MYTETMPLRKAHHGHNVKRLREILGVKQEYLAEQIDMSQQTMSRYEQKEEIEDEVLDRIAKVLKVPVEAIKNFNEEAAVNFIANTFNDEAIAFGTHYKCTFNPLDKVVELYERMLKEKDEEVALLQEALREKNKF